MRVTIMGAGAIGSVVGGLMANAGHEVCLIGRQEHMDAIARNGLRISGIFGTYQVKNIETRCRPGGPIPEVLILAVKSYDTADVVAEIDGLIGPETLVCAYQNGLGNAEAIAEGIGWRRTVGVRAIYGAVCPRPGAAEVTVIAQPTALGPWSKDAPADRIRALAEAMDAAGLPTVYTETIAATLWAKVAYNCMLNPLSALLDVPYGALAETAETRKLMEAALREVYAVGHAKGVLLEPDHHEAYTRLFYEELLPPTAAHYASMREDLRQQRRTEIDALNGAIVRFGEEVNIETPVNRFLRDLIRAREQLSGIQTRGAGI